MEDEFRNANFWVELRKMDEEQRIVEGFASTEAIDKQGGIWKGQLYQGDQVSAEAVRDALPGYMEWANLREMHQNSAVGKVLKAEVIEGDVEVNGQAFHSPLHIIAKIVDDDAWRKIKEGIYKGFSIGGNALEAALEKIGKLMVRVIKRLELLEISLVDRPANPGARILLWKSVSLDDQINAIRSAWQKAFGNSTVTEGSIIDNSWITDVLDDQVIVQKPDGLYAFPYQRAVDGTVTFGEGMKVKREYVPLVGAAEGNGPMKGASLAPQQSGGAEVTTKVEKTEERPTGEHPVEEVAVIEKVADPAKALGMLQSLRDESEVNGNLEGAALYTQAIALLLQAAGEAETDETPVEENPETGESAPEDGAEAPEGDLQMAANPTLRKAGRTFSGGNSQAMHGVIQAIAQMLAKTGDAVADAVLKCYGPKKEEEKVETPDLQKAAGQSDIIASLQPTLDDLQKVLGGLGQRIEALERQPQEGGPVLRPVEKVMAAASNTPQPETPEPEKPNIAELRKLAAVTPDPLKKAEFARQLWNAEHATTKK